LLLLAAGSVVGADAAYRGRQLGEVLRELQGSGLELIYSSAVVGDDLVVTVEPSGTTPRAILDEVLEPLGLMAEEGPSGTLVILPRPAQEPPAPAERKPAFSTEVIVTPGRHSLIREDPAQGRAIDHGDTVLVPNIGGDISRVVERLPGVAAADNSAAFNVRGSLAADTSFVLDGLELYEPFHLQSFQSPFSLIDSQLVSRAELLSGGYTADYGDRHGGFLDISTVTPGTDSRGEIELGTLNSRVAYGAPLNDRASWLLSVRGWYPEALNDSLELGGGERLRPRFGDAYTKWTWSPSAKTLVSAHGLFAYDNLAFDETGEIDNESVDATTNSSYIWFRVLNSWSASVSTDTVLSVGAIDKSREGVAAPDDGTFLVNDDRELEFVGLTQGVNWQVSDKQLVKAGFYARQLRAKYRYSTEETTGAGDVEIMDNPSGSSVGLYAAFRARLSSSVATEFGLRWDRQDYTDDNQLSPRFNLLWRLDDRTDVRFAVGRFQQSQRIHELHVEDGETEFQSAEIARQVELTFRHRFRDGLRLRVDAYDRLISDTRPRYENLFQPIELFPETSENRVVVEPDEARLRGVEFLISGDETRPFVWWVSYVWSSARDQIDGAWFPRSWDQPHAGKFLVGHRWADRWFVSVAGSVHTGWPTTPVEPVVSIEPDGSTTIEPVLGPRNSIRFPTYARLDLKVQRTFRLSGSRLALTLDVINLTDRENACCVDDFSLELQPDGSAVARPEYEYWLGITPSFSVRWEF
jgi:hypothetical protein